MQRNTKRINCFYAKRKQAPVRALNSRLRTLARSRLVLLRGGRPSRERKKNYRATLRLSIRLQSIRKAFVKKEFAVRSQTLRPEQRPLWMRRTSRKTPAGNVSLRRRPDISRIASRRTPDNYKGHRWWPERMVLEELAFEWFAWSKRRTAEVPCESDIHRRDIQISRRLL